MIKIKNYIFALLAAIALVYIVFTLMSYFGHFNDPALTENNLPNVQVIASPSLVASDKKTSLLPNESSLYDENDSIEFFEHLAKARNGDARAQLEVSELILYCTTLNGVGDFIEQDFYIFLGFSNLESKQKKVLEQLILHRQQCEILETLSPQELGDDRTINLVDVRRHWALKAAEQGDMDAIAHLVNMSEKFESKAQLNKYLQLTLTALKEKHLPTLYGFITPMAFSGNPLHLAESSIVGVYSCENGLDCSVYSRRGAKLILPVCFDASAESKGSSEKNADYEKKFDCIFNTKLRDLYKNSFNIDTPDNTEDSLKQWVDALDEQYVYEVMTTSFWGQAKNSSRN